MSATIETHEKLRWLCGCGWVQPIDPTAGVEFGDSSTCGSCKGKAWAETRVHDASKETVDHPAHYGGADNPFEAIKVIEHLGWGAGFNRGSALKYLMRAGRKGSCVTEREDLRKARWYLDREIARLS